MELKKPYVDINDTLKHIRLQVLQSVPYAKKVSPIFDNPHDLFRWLKNRTIYKNDPREVELLQTMQTLMDNNWHGIPGAGDCDCFTITCLACCIAQGWGLPLWIKLAGRNKRYPVHIWSGVKFEGRDIALDLTERVPGSERSYPYVQKINFEY